MDDNATPLLQTDVSSTEIGLLYARLADANDRIAALESEQSAQRAHDLPAVVARLDTDAGHLGCEIGQAHNTLSLLEERVRALENAPPPTDVVACIVSLTARVDALSRLVHASSAYIEQLVWLAQNPPPRDEGRP